MEHSKKFALVPLDRIQQFEEEHLGDLDKQIQHILKRKINDSEKAKLYIQILQKYVSFPDVNAVKHQEQTTEQIIDQTPEKTFDIETEVLKSVPAKHKNTATRIMEFLKRHEISWNHNKEVKLDNEFIPGSNIVQFINFLLRNRARKPFAFDQFKEKIKFHHLPQEFIKNNYLTDLKTMYAKPKTVSGRRKLSFNNWLNL